MLIKGENLFPLHHIIANGSGYFMTFAGEVYSNKSGMFKRLAGSLTKSGRYFTLSGKTYRADDLIRSARRHILWIKEIVEPVHTSKVKEQVESVKATENERRSYATNMQNAISLRGVMIATVENDKLVFGTNPKFHVTEQSWKDEMIRLAKLKPGTKFVAVKIVQSVVAGGVTWE